MNYDRGLIILRAQFEQTNHYAEFTVIEVGCRKICGMKDFTVQVKTLVLREPELSAALTF